MSGSESKTDAGAKAHALSYAACVAALREENLTLWNRWRRTVIAACVALLALLAAFAALETWVMANGANAVVAVATLVVAALVVLLLIALGLLRTADPVPGVPVGWLLASRYGIDGVDRPDDLVPASGSLDAHRTRPGRRDTWTIVRDGDLICVYDANGNVVEPMDADAQGAAMTAAGEDA